MRPNVSNIYEGLLTLQTIEEMGGHACYGTQGCFWEARTVINEIPHSLTERIDSITPVEEEPAMICKDECLLKVVLMEKILKTLGKCESYARSGPPSP